MGPTQCAFLDIGMIDIPRTFLNVLHDEQQSGFFTPLMQTTLMFGTVSSLTAPAHDWHTSSYAMLRSLSQD